MRRLFFQGSKLLFYIGTKKKNVKKIGQFLETHISKTTKSILICKVVYIESINHVNLIEIGPVVIEIQGVENGDLVVPVNNTLVCRTSFLAADTQPCILILYIHSCLP